MKRVCGNCHKTLGEKCSKCGSLQVVAIMRDGPFSIWKCLDCFHSWRSGDDPETTGFCEECFAAGKP